MKKNLFLALAATTLVLTACSSKEDEPFGGVRPGAHPVEITFDLAVNSGVESRSGRELWSSEALQSVKYVDIYMFGTDGNYIKTLSTKDANTLKPNDSASDFAATGTQSTESHSYRFVENMGEGSYTFLAIGYESNPETAYTVTPPTSTTKVGDILLQLQEEKAEEVFVGLSQQYEIGKEATSLYASVTLYRAVAGVLGYFKHIPYNVSIASEDGLSVQNVKVTKLVVRVAGKATAVKMPEDHNANKMVTTNGTSSTEYYSLMSFDLTSLGMAEDGNWFSIPTNNWRAEGRESAPTKVTKIKDSVLGGQFILPFSPAANMTTMQVVLYYKDDAGTEHEAKVYNVYCKKEYTASTSNTQDKDEKFNVLPNHFYGLGQKYHNDPANPTEGTDPNNPDPDPENPKDPDEPIDLSAVEYITITVNASWEMIHQLGLKLD